MKKLLLFLLPVLLFGGSVVEVRVTRSEAGTLLREGQDILSYSPKTGKAIIYTKNTKALKIPYRYVIKDTKKWWDKSPFKINFGPYYTYDEAVTEMDRLYSIYPQLVGEKFAIGTTWEGRTILAFEVTNFDGTESSRPAVLYEAAIHAREPGGVSTLFGFIWYLVRNYEKNSDVTNILNSRRIYIIPIVNPDGYVYNESSDGYWRKNKRDNDNDGIFEENDDGVDLNRNFSYEWGYDDAGSSPDPTTQTYRGPSPFSEPETQAIKWLTDSIQPIVAIDYHTYSNLLMFPWGYANIPIPDDSVMRAFAERMTEVNGYAVGRPGELLYNANGVTVDWWYSDSTHPKIFAYTAEVGEDFWQPDTTIILGQINENIPMNMLLAEMAGKYIEISSVDTDTTSLTHNFRIENLSATSHEEGTVITLNQDSLLLWGINPTYDSMYIPYLGILPYKNDTTMSITLNLPPTYTPGWANLTFNINYAQGETMEQKVPVIIGNAKVMLFSANFDTGYSAFTTNHWDTTATTFVSAPYSITDSKGGPYNNQDTSYLVTPYIDLSDSEALYYVAFYTKYSLEPDYDYAYFQIQESGSSIWNTLKSFNDSTGWHRVEFDISSYRGKTVRFRFYMVTDYSVTYDGIYVDDMTVYAIPRFISGIKETQNRIKVTANNSFINTLKVSSSRNTISTITVYNSAGRRIQSFNIRLHRGQNTISLPGLKTGKYTVFVGKKRYHLLIVDGK